MLVVILMCNTSQLIDLKTAQNKAYRFLSISAMKILGIFRIDFILIACFGLLIIVTKQSYFWLWKKLSTSRHKIGFSQKNESQVMKNDGMDNLYHVATAK